MLRMLPHQQNNAGNGRVQRQNLGSIPGDGAPEGQSLLLGTEQPPGSKTSLREGALPHGMGMEMGRMGPCPASPWWKRAGPLLPCTTWKWYLVFPVSPTQGDVCRRHLVGV